MKRTVLLFALLTCSNLIFSRHISPGAEKVDSLVLKSLKITLDSIYNNDQDTRRHLDELEGKFRWDSDTVQQQFQKIVEQDSLNLIQVTEILDTYGWLGPDAVGSIGNSALFLVIQHANLGAQIKYLPLMREAVNKGMARGGDLALLEDRVLIRQGKRQIYGSQIGVDKETGKYYVQPLDDPDNVDKRRTEAGLQPFVDYLLNWQLIWDPEQYKKELPVIEAKTKKY